MVTEIEQSERWYISCGCDQHGDHLGCGPECIVLRGCHHVIGVDYSAATVSEADEHEHSIRCSVRQGPLGVARGEWREGVPVENPRFAAEIERLCEVMHDAYEAAAAGNGWETQAASRKPWKDVPEANKATMRVAVRALYAEVFKDVG